ncbi:MAG: VCBS repeat-containing protein [Myxococcales bacterium]|nr:VCBS repeat-containing protein [Myxococcales bacterium]
MRSIAFITTLLALAGCRLAPYGDLEDRAPIVALRAVDYPVSSFGNVLTTLEGPTGASRIAASAGTGSPFRGFDGWNGGATGSIGSFELLYEGCSRVTGDNANCERGASAALAGIASWGDERDCVMSSSLRVGLGASTDEGFLRVRCESLPRASFRLTRVPDVELGTSLAALAPGSALGVALVGAPGVPGGGGLYRVAQDATAAAPIALPDDLDLPSNARLGVALATAPIADAASVGLTSGASLILAGAPGASRVVVLAGGTFDDPMDGPGLRLVLLGCVDGIRTRAPSATLMDGLAGLAAGDVTGDGVPEIFVGTDGSGVRMVRLGDVSGGVGCGASDTSDDPPSTAIACPSVEGVTCGGFGAALAVGDANGDGVGDLLVGAPTSRTSEGETGAAYVLPGAAAGLDVATARALVPSSATDGALIGEEVAFFTGAATPGGGRRSEPVASAPGADRVYVFLCTGLAGDAVGDAGLDDRCQP